MPFAPSRIVPFLPAALLLLFSEWSGTLWHGAQAIPAGVGWLATGALCLAAAPRARDLFDLGGRAAWLPVVLAVAVVAALALSPVARAGMTGALVLPLLLTLPAAIASCWRDERERSAGVAAVVAVVGAIALHAAIAHRAMGTERAALPLGQHNLLATWLVLLLPVALVPALGGRWRRLLALVASALALVALGLTGSLAGVAGWLVEAVVLTVALHGILGDGGRRARRFLLAGLALLGAAAIAATAPRLLAILNATDSSLLARLGYLKAAVHGFLERPLLGWGPGSSAWLLSEHLNPVPGVHPPYEVVTDAHSFWLDALFELGIVGAGALVLLLALFVVRRSAELRRLPAGPPSAARWASVASVLGGGVCLLGAGSFDVSALGVAAAVPLALGLSAEGAGPTGAPTRAPRWLAWLVVACLLALLPSRIAHWHFDRFAVLGGRASGEDVAAGAGSSGAERAQDTGAPRSARRAAVSRHLDRAVRLDPAFPLYRFRRAVEAGGENPVAGLRSAARGARGIGAFWLVAGARAGQAGMPGFRADLERACDLDPLGALAPFVLAVLTPAEPDATERLARALLAEPRLAAAARLEETGGLIEEALRRIERLDGVPLGWRASVVEQVRGARSADRGETPELVDLTLELDGLGSTSLSLHAFRRRPLRTPVLSVQVSREQVARITAPGAFVLPETDRGVLAGGCRLAP